MAEKEGDKQRGAERESGECQQMCQSLLCFFIGSSGNELRKHVLENYSYRVYNNIGLYASLSVLRWYPLSESTRRYLHTLSIIFQYSQLALI